MFAESACRRRIFLNLLQSVELRMDKEKIAKTSSDKRQILYDYWKALGADQERYEAEKKQVGITLMEALDKKIPGLAKNLEVIDVATPLTTERYTGNWRGSMEGWLVTTKNINLAFGEGMRKTLPGLENFYMIGQWVEPGGGIPTAAMSARFLIKNLCKKDKKRFTTKVVN